MYKTKSGPEDWIKSIQSSSNPPAAPHSPSYGLDSPLGCLASNVAAPLYLYASLKGKHDLWDRLLADLPDAVLAEATLDMGCGRGMVLLKTAQRKKAMSHITTRPAYGIDIFNSADQTGNSPRATYANAATLDALDRVVLHTASFTETLPFADEVFTLVTSSLALHNVDEAGRKRAVEEIVRVCKPGATVLLMDLRGYVKGYADILIGLGWRDVTVSWAGMGVMYGLWPCQVVIARKPW